MPRKRRPSRPSGEEESASKAEAGVSDGEVSAEVPASEFGPMGSTLAEGLQAPESVEQVEKNTVDIDQLQSQSELASARLETLQAAAEVAALTAEAKAAEVASVMDSAVEEAKEVAEAALSEMATAVGEESSTVEGPERAQETEEKSTEEEATETTAEPKPFTTSTVSEGSKTVPVAYALLAVSLCGLSGLHRFYLGRPISGVLYFCTFGFCFVGTLFDLVTMTKLVEEANTEAKQS